MLTIYGVYRSRASRPLWLLNEIGMPFEQIPVIQAYRLPDPQAADAPFNTASAAFLQVNPQGQVPCMKDDDLVLTESMAITLHIARSYGGGIGPQTDADDARMQNWAFFAATSIEDHALKIMQALTGDKAGTAESKATVDAEAQALRRPFARLEAHLAAHPFMMGDGFTVADILVAECCRYAQPHPTLIGEFPALEGWLEKCQARPAFKAMWEKRLSEPA